MTDKASLPVRGIEPYQPETGEEYMNEAQQAHFQAILEAWKQQLLDEVERTVSHMRDDANHYADPADRATQEEEFALELRTRDRERKLIRKIDKTMDLIRNDDYGFCEQCGVEIGLRRLEARPTATLCVDCKTLEEIREKQRVA
jgi:DnaK suppressor protein